MGMFPRSTGQTCTLLKEPLIYEAPHLSTLTLLHLIQTHRLTRPLVSQNLRILLANSKMPNFCITHTFLEGQEALGSLFKKPPLGASK